MWKTVGPRPGAFSLLERELFRGIAIRGIANGNKRWQTDNVLLCTTNIIKVHILYAKGISHVHTAQKNK